jgi:phosphatidylglycerophosphate synthase
MFSKLTNFFFLFSQRKYLLFVIYHTVSGFLDAFDGILARALDQRSLVGQYFELILDQYAHYIMYVCIGLLYPSYIVYFYLELALELWNSTYNLYIHTLPKTDKPWLHKETFLSTMCSVSIHDHPNLRLFNWYGPDIFHTFLIIRHILIKFIY